jgi:uncharacterized OB-fold protein
MTDLPVPVPNPETAPFWKYCAVGTLHIQQCSACGVFRHPPQPMCAECGSMAREWAPVSGHGEVFSYATTRQPIHPALRDRVPFTSVLVELPEGVLLTSNVIDCAPEDIYIGMPVTVTFEPVDEEIAIPRFRRREI